MATTDRTNIKYLRDIYKIGFDAYEPSKAESRRCWDLFHNRHYTRDQLNLLGRRGQPKETFNVVKLFARILLGYYSTLINTVQCEPVAMEDAPTASLLTDILDHIFRDNNFTEEGEKIKLSGLITGLMVSYTDVKPTGKTDKYNRPINKITEEYVPESEITLDPMSTRDDYSDARWIHRHKWLSEEAIISTFGKEKLKDMTEYYNLQGNESADFTYGSVPAAGVYKIHNNYLVIHTIVIDEDGDSWSIFWHNEQILQKDKITHKEVKFPYRVVKVHSSHDTDSVEYYGIFREVIETQFAINQAVIKLQLLINSQRVFVNKNAVKNISTFTDAVNRITGVIEVKNVAGVKVEDMSKDASAQYQIIENGYERVKKILGINDSFLGQAFASDSGRKVKLQQNSAMIALRYFTGKVETFYRLIGWDTVNLVKQYYTAEQVIRIADDATGHRWAHINKPATLWDGRKDANGQPIIDPNTGQPTQQVQYEQVYDPASGEPLEDEEGNLIFAPIPEATSEIAFTNVDVKIVSTSYNDEDEKNQLLIEEVLQGSIGKLLSQVNPSGFMKMASLALQSTKTKNSPEMSQILLETSQMLAQNQQASQEASMMAQGGSAPVNPKSATLKLPQNTNEGP